MQIYIADYSVDGPATSHANFHFLKIFVSATTSDVFMTMADWVRQSGIDPKVDLLLQIDIEGHEHETFLSIPDELMQRFRITVLEFHCPHQLWSLPFFRLASSAFRKILQNHACVHLSPNNCLNSIYMQGIDIPRVVEFTFLRRDRFSQSAFSHEFPPSA